MPKPLIIVWFSCGSASAVAAKLTIEHYSGTHEVEIVNCDTRPSENSDNYRFSKDVEKWIGQPIRYISNPEFKDVDEVFEKRKYMAGIHGAICTVELKKRPRQHDERAANAINVFGFTADKKEFKRSRRFQLKNPEMSLLWVLQLLGITKKQCHNMIAGAGIRTPTMYLLGYENNNCPGCVKATSAWYWDKIRSDFPSVFRRRCEQSRKLGVRLVRVKGKRIFLDELPPGPFNKPRQKENLSCGPECGGSSK